MFMYILSDILTITYTSEIISETIAEITIIEA